MTFPVPVAHAQAGASPVPAEWQARDSDETAFRDNFVHFVDLLLAVAHKTPNVLSPLRDVRLPLLVPAGVSVVQLTAISCILECTKASQPVPGWAMLAAKIQAKIMAINPAMVSGVHEAVARIEALKIDPTRDVSVALKFAGWIRRETEIKPAAAMAMRDISLGRKTLSQGSQLLGQLASNETPVRAASNPLSFADAFEGDVMSTGLPWFDALFGTTPGLLRGSGYSCIATTGGGKTTLAYQLAFSMARLGRKILVVTSEQTYRERMLVCRLWSTATGIPFQKFAEYTGTDEPPDDLVSAEMKAKVYSWLKNITFFDFTESQGSLEEIDNLASMHKPDVIILDWAGTFANQLLEAQKYEKLEQAVLAVADYMRGAATRHGCATFTLHQIAGALGTNPFMRLDHTNAADCRKFSINMGYAIVMTPPDSNKVFEIKVTKCRYGVGRGQFVRIDPHVTRLVPIEGQVRKGKGGMWQTGEPGTIPAETKPRAKSTGGF